MKMLIGVVAAGVLALGSLMGGLMVAGADDDALRLIREDGTVMDENLEVGDPIEFPPERAD